MIEKASRSERARLLGHHYVPQKYLSRFRDPGTRNEIWLYSRGSAQPRLVGIPGVAQSQGFYEPDDEQKLGDLIEAPANVAIEKLLVGLPISDEDRLKLSFYMGAMIRRVPFRRRRTYETIVPPVLEEILSDLRREIVMEGHLAKADQLAVAFRLAQVSEYERRLEGGLPKEIHDSVRSPWPTPKIVVGLYDLAWRVLVPAPDDFFLTCDNPVFFFEQYGIGSELSEISFPLSSDRCLHGSKQGPVGGLAFMKARKSLVDEINKRLLSTTERTAFFHQEVEWISPLLDQDEHALNLVQWVDPD